MDTIDTLKINFILKQIGNKDIIEAEVVDKKFSIDFTSDDQSKLRDFFLCVLNIMEKSKQLIEFIYSKDSNYNNPLFEKVASEYIDGLNKELKTIFDDMKKIF